MIKAFCRPCWRRARASIVNMSSAASSIKGVPNRFVYGATKAAVIGMTKALAADFTAKGIRFNAICPGTVDTPSLTERMKAAGRLRESQAPPSSPASPWAAWPQPEEIAAARRLSRQRRGGLRHRPDLRHRRRLVDLRRCRRHDPVGKTLLLPIG